MLTKVLMVLFLYFELVISCVHGSHDVYLMVTGLLMKNAETCIFLSQTTSYCGYCLTPTDANTHNG